VATSEAGVYVVLDVEHVGMELLQVAIETVPGALLHRVQIEIVMNEPVETQLCSSKPVQRGRLQPDRQPGSGSTAAYQPRHPLYTSTPT